MTELIHVDPEQLVTYLYDECDPVERARVAAHLAVCMPCADDIAALTATRVHLADWAPPDVALGFQITRPAAADATGPARVLRPARWWSQPLPAWAQAAAAVMIFGAGLAVGVGRGTVTPERIVERAAPEGVATAAAPAIAQSRAAAQPADDRLERQVEQLRADLASLRRASTAAPGSSPTPDQLIAQVKALVQDSEERQRIEFTLRSAQLVSDLTDQRRIDFAQVNESLGRVQGQAGAAVRQQGQRIQGLERAVSLSAAPR